MRYAARKGTDTSPLGPSYGASSSSLRLYQSLFCLGGCVGFRKMGTVHKPLGARWDSPHFAPLALLPFLL